MLNEAEVEKLRLEPRLARVHVALVLEPAAQCRRRVLELFVGDEPLDQDVARLFWREVGELVVELEVRGALVGNERSRLDLQQGRRDHEEVACHVEVEVLHVLDLVEVLVCDLRDGDGADVDALARHEAEQQVERALERLNSYAE